MQTENLPAQQAQSPLAVVESQYNQMAQGFMSQAEQLTEQTRQGIITEDQHNEAILGLQQQAVEQVGGLRQVAQQMMHLDELASSGMIDPRQAQEAQWRLILPSDVANAAFKMPRKEVDAAFSPQSLAATDESGRNALQRIAEGFIEPVSEIKGERWRIDEEGPLTLFEAAKDYATRSEVPKTQINQALTEAFIQFKDYTQYETFEPAKRKQLDQAFDSMVSELGFEDAWDPEEPFVQALRAKGPFTRAAAGASPNQRTTEWSRRIRENVQNKQRQQQQPRKELTEDAARALLQEAGGNPDRARELANQRGYKL